ncbi:PDR/VanB family oxidoreductase [Actinokineospora guangxiensis]|uniref:PDR/VanB family oxidoreductase n=1 Tax=Actinokineospora guangxiensis TaxID=1490288 RepID=A0ABW0ERY8_9PSEU
MPTEPALDLVLEKKEALADGVVELTLRSPDGRDLPPWAPGAHIDIVLGDGLVRQYSLCGDPAERSVLQVAVLREPASRGGSAYVHERLAIGDAVEVRGPRNHFALAGARRYIFIAGGIGITPIVPMIAAAAAAGAEWHLFYGGRTRTSMAFADVLEDRHPDNVSIQPQDEAGILDLLEILADPAPDVAVYCCGPEPLLAAVEAECARWPQGALHLERFVAKPGAAEGPSRSFEVELAQSGLTLTVPEHRSILEVVSAAGVDVYSSCQEGTCGTCEVGVLSGTPDHRDSILGPTEREEGQAMMICVSRAVSARLVLDI